MFAGGQWVVCLLLDGESKKQAEMCLNFEMPSIPDVMFQMYLKLNKRTDEEEQNATKRRIDQIL